MYRDGYDLIAEDGDERDEFDMTPFEAKVWEDFMNGPASSCNGCGGTSNECRDFAAVAGQLLARWRAQRGENTALVARVREQDEEITYMRGLLRRILPATWREHVTVHTPWIEQPIRLLLCEEIERAIHEEGIND